MVVSRELVGKPAIVPAPGQIVYGIGRSTLQVKVEVADFAADATTAAPPAKADAAAGDAASAPTDPATDDKTKDKKDKTAKAGNPTTNAQTPAPLTDCKSVRNRFRQDWFTYDQSYELIDELNDYVDNITQHGHFTTFTTEQVALIDQSLKAWQSTIDANLAAGIEASALSGIITSACPNTLKVTMTTAVEADTGHLFVAEIHRDTFSSDDVSLKVDGTGLISAASTTADDQTGTVLVNAAQSLGTVVEFAANVASGGLGEIVVTGSRVVKKGAAPDLAKLLTQFEKAPDNQKPAILKSILALIHAVMFDPPDRIDPNLPSAPQTFLISDLIATPAMVAGSVIIKADCTKNLTGYTPSGNDNSTYPGLVAPMSRPCTIVASAVTRPPLAILELSDPNAADKFPKDSDGNPYTVGDELGRASMIMADSSTLEVIEMARSRFVKTVTELAFTNGQLVSTHFSRPSAASAVAALPGNIIGGFLNGIATGITAKNNSLSSEASVITARAALTTANANMITATTAAKAAAASK